MKWFRTLLGIALIGGALSQTTNAQVTPLDGLVVGPADTIMMYSYSSNQVDITALTTSGSPVIRVSIGGIGELAANMPMTGSALTGDSGTIVGVTAWQSQAPLDGSTNANISSNTTLSGLSTNDCARAKQYALVSAGTQSTTAANGIPINTYLTTDCVAGSATMSQAATATAALTNVNFTPAIIMNANLDETHSSISTDAATFVAKYTTSLKVNYRIRQTSGVVVDSFSETNMATDYTENTEQSDPLVDGVLQRGTVYPSAGDPLPGATYIILELIRDGEPYATLACGTATEKRPLEFPGECVPPEKVERVRTIAYPGPLTGANIYVPVPTNVSREMTSAGVIFQTSTTSGFRYPMLKLTNREGITSYNVPFTGAGIMGPSSTRLMTVGQGVQPIVNDNNQITSGVVWSDAHTPGALNQIATITMPAPGENYRNVIECITGSIVNGTGATAGAAVFQLVNDADVVYHFTLSAPIGPVGATYVLAGNTHTVCPEKPWIIDANKAAIFRTSAASVDAVHYVAMKGHIEYIPVGMYGSLPPHRLLGGGKAQFVFTGSHDIFTDDIWSELQASFIERWAIQ